MKINLPNSPQFNKFKEDIKRIVDGYGGWYFLDWGPELPIFQNITQKDLENYYVKDNENTDWKSFSEVIQNFAYVWEEMKKNPSKNINHVFDIYFP